MRKIIIPILAFSLLLGSLLLGQNILDTFEDGTTQGWRMGPSPGAINVPNGGPNGAGDAYLELHPDGSGSFFIITVPV